MRMVSLAAPSKAIEAYRVVLPDGRIVFAPHETPMRQQKARVKSRLLRDQWCG